MEIYREGVEETNKGQAEGRREGGREEGRRLIQFREQSPLPGDSYMSYLMDLGETIFCSAPGQTWWPFKFIGGSSSKAESRPARHSVWGHIPVICNRSVLAHIQWPSATPWNLHRAPLMLFCRRLSHTTQQASLDDWMTLDKLIEGKIGSS